MPLSQILNTVALHIYVIQFYPKLCCVSMVMRMTPFPPSRGFTTATTLSFCFQQMFWAILFTCAHFMNSLTKLWSKATNKWHYLLTTYIHLLSCEDAPFSSCTVQIQLIKTTPQTWKITGSWGFCGQVPPGHYHATPVVLQWCLGSSDYSGAVSPSVRNLKCFSWIRFVFKQYVIAHWEKMVVKWESVTI